MHTNGGHGARATVATRGTSRSQAIRSLAARTLRRLANELDPPRAPLTWNGMDYTRSSGATYRLTFLR